MANTRPALERCAEIDWQNVKPSEMPNMLMNIFGNDPSVGYDHPLVKVGLFRLREALARVSNSLDGYFGPT